MKRAQAMFIALILIFRTESLLWYWRAFEVDFLPCLFPWILIGRNYKVSTTTRLPRQPFTIRYQYVNCQVKTKSFDVSLISHILFMLSLHQSGFAAIVCRCAVIRINMINQCCRQYTSRGQRGNSSSGRINKTPLLVERNASCFTKKCWWCIYKYL